MRTNNVNFFFLFCFCISLFINGNSANASVAIVPSQDSIIVIDPIPILFPDNNIPRLPVLVPISASYEPLLSSVLLTFTSNLGEIEVEVMNTTIGGYFSDFVDTQFLYATIPITMGQGHYILLFTLPSGRQYKGEFDV